MNDLLIRAENLGGSRLKTVVQMILDGGLTFPIPDREARRYRGIGPHITDQLRKLGLVTVVTSDFDQLSGRSFNVLQNLGVTTKQQVIDAIREGRLVPEKTRGYGWVSHKEVCKWCGLPEPEKAKPVICPHCGQNIKHQVSNRPRR